MPYLQNVSISSHRWTHRSRPLVRDSTADHCQRSNTSPEISRHELAPGSTWRFPCSIYLARCYSQFRLLGLTSLALVVVAGCQLRAVQCRKYCQQCMLPQRSRFSEEIDRLPVTVGCPMLHVSISFIGVPVLLLAILLGHLSQLAAIRLSSPPVNRRLARIGLLIGYGSLVFIGGAFESCPGCVEIRAQRRCPVICHLLERRWRRPLLIHFQRGGSAGKRPRCVALMSAHRATVAGQLPPADTASLGRR
jgi:hypothetical protein